MAYKDFEGKTEEEAIAKALKEFNLTQEEIRTEILEDTGVKARFFGFSVKNVKVRVFYQEKSNDEAKKDSFLPKEKVEQQEENIESTELSDIAQKGKDFIQKILDDLELEAKVILVKENNDAVRYILSAKNPHLIIGRKGILLESIQSLAYMVANKNRVKWKKILIDVDKYRKRREQRLKEEMKDIAYRVKRTGKAYLTNPFSPYDRRIIHMVVQEMDGLKSESEGNGLFKRVWIKPF